MAAPLAAALAPPNGIPQEMVNTVRITPTQCNAPALTPAQQQAVTNACANARTAAGTVTRLTDYRQWFIILQALDQALANIPGYDFLFIVNDRLHSFINGQRKNNYYNSLDDPRPNPDEADNLTTSEIIVQLRQPPNAVWRAFISCSETGTVTNGAGMHNWHACLVVRTPITPLGASRPRYRWTIFTSEANVAATDHEARRRLLNMHGNALEFIRVVAGAAFDNHLVELAVRTPTLPNAPNPGPLDCARFVIECWADIVANALLYPLQDPLTVGNLATLYRYEVTR